MVSGKYIYVADYGVGLQILSRDMPTPLVTVTPTTVTPTIQPELPESGKKVRVYPNPAINTDRVNFAWEETAVEKVRITIYDIIGKCIATLTTDAPGQMVIWNTEDVARGIYFYQVILTVNGIQQKLPVNKLAIVK